VQSPPARSLVVAAPGAGRRETGRSGVRACTSARPPWP